MSRYFLIRVCICSLVFLPACASAENGLSFRQIYPQDKIVTLGHAQNAPVLVIFWRSDCAPCRIEQPILIEVARSHPQLHIALISLQDEAQTRNYFGTSPASNMAILIAQDNAKKILLSMGDTRAALPFSAYLNADGTICETHYGVLGTEIVNNWIEEC